MIKKIFYGIVIIVIIFIIVGFFLPKDIHLERSTFIHRPPSTVFALVNGYQTFNSWSPWAARDPSAVYEITGPETGVGARMEWEGDPRLSGKGSQEIIESTPYSLVRTRLEFDQQGAAIAYFQISPEDGGSQVTWGFDTDVTEGQNLFGSLMARYFGLLFDRWIGTDYELGLSNLKTLAESLPDVDFSDLDVEIMEAQPQDILFIESGSSQDPADIADALAIAYQEIMAFMFDHSIEMAAQPMTITRAWNESGYSFDAAIPVVIQPEVMETVELNGKVQLGTSPSGRVVRVIHRGPYDQMRPTYEKLSAYMTSRGLREGPVSWEQYISDPGDTDESNLVTHIYFLVEP